MYSLLDQTLLTLVPLHLDVMDSAPPTGENVTPSSADQLPDAAVALATRFFEAARQGQMDMFEQALPHGLPANLTNGKGDTLVSTNLNLRYSPI